ncbi:helicase Cas3 [Enhygromyxa salina]|uniref:Helicase Cas3 n=1 Tax=Enhygromyxa salina TaxID=215803 RepID=A0A2S9YMF1_9BACT|nr:helicase Cas3 [Enhygromyxa salina]
MGAESSPSSDPVFVVATSCIEAGADLDFDTLVTEAASLDALRQRFGRLNRVGAQDKPTAWVLARRDQVAAKAPEDPVYGNALRETWAYLEEVARAEVVDFGLASFPEPPDERRPLMLPPAPEAPVLFPRYLDMWSETRPAPHPDPDVALWLHGKNQARERDINVVFRADIVDPTTDSPEELAALAQVAGEVVEFMPPVSDEAVSVAIHEFRGWLGKRDESRVWRWTADGLEAASPRELVVGDTVIVAATRGGLHAGTWDPDSQGLVEDIADRATYARHGVAKLRVDPRTLPAGLGEPPTPSSSDDPDEIDAAKQRCLDWLRGLTKRLSEVALDWHPLLTALASPHASYSLTPGRSASDELIWRVTVLPPRRAIEATTEDVVSVFSGIEVTLASHLEDVEAWAAEFAKAAGLDADIAQDVALAGLLHDLGKADTRFQALLRGGDPIQVAGAQPLAKSRQFGSAKARARALQRSGWPLGLRHELVSLALLDASPELQSRAHDLDLVRHLVASHHGWCRPWAPATVDAEPTLVRVAVAGIEVEVSTAALDDDLLNECASRFRRLCRSYGWHGLAYLEALLRLGDHRASKQPGLRPGREP